MKRSLRFGLVIAGRLGRVHRCLQRRLDLVIVIVVIDDGEGRGDADG